SRLLLVSTCCFSSKFAMNFELFRVRFYVEPWRSNSLWSSKKVTCFGIVWQVQAMIDPGSHNREENIRCPTSLSTFLVACKAVHEDSSHFRHWEAAIEGVLTIIHPKNSSKNLTCEFSNTFSAEQQNFERVDECNCDYCTDKGDCCTLDENNCITVEVRMRVGDNMGFSLPPFLDFTVSNGHTDVILVIEDKQIYLNKKELSSLVPALGRLCDTGESTVVIENVKYEDFVDFLRVVYPSQAPISDTNFKALLEFAKQYSLQHLTDQIEEDLLIGDHYFRPTEGLILIVKYGLKNYRDWVASERRSWDDRPQISV
ncbi:hypothetical protein PRIPAC_93934, partial [Pristionchus pacificus]